jgi:hypothetical protein
MSRRAGFDPYFPLRRTQGAPGRIGSDFPNPLLVVAEPGNQQNAALWFGEIEIARTGPHDARLT